MDSEAETTIGDADCFGIDVERRNVRMTLLEKIIDEASGPITDLPSLLRKVKVLARKLQNRMLESWVDKELLGYEATDDLPPYRILKTSSMGRFYVDGRHSKLRINPSILPDAKWREMATTVRLDASVSQYAAALENPLPNRAPGVFWSLNAIQWAQNNISFYDHHHLESAWLQVDLHDYKAMLDNVQSRILDFALNVAEEAPDAGEVALGDEPKLPVPVTNQLVINAFQWGSGSQAIYTGTGNTVQIITNGVRAGDWPSLEGALAKLGVPPGKVAELQDLLVTDKGNGGGVERKDGGIRQWIVDAASSVQTGVLEGMGAVGAQATITAAIQAFQGLAGTG